MGKTARKMVSNADELIEEMNRALADEWLAYMQYMFSAAIIKAPIAAKELKDIAKEELEHADELTERIIQLGGTPLVDPKQFYDKTNCGYEVPVEDTKSAIQAALKGEACAIDVYSKIAAMAKETDPVTYNLMLHIMEEEEQHEQRYEDLLDWMSQ